MKPHVLDSEEPLLDGDQVALCGVLVIDAQPVWTAEEDIRGWKMEDLLRVMPRGTCRKCLAVGISKRYVYVLVPGAEISEVEVD